METFQEVLRHISVARHEILSVVDAVYGGTPQWPFVRSQLLRILGERGLEGRVGEYVKGAGAAVESAMEGAGNGQARQGGEPLVHGRNKI